MQRNCSCENISKILKFINKWYKRNIDNQETEQHIKKLVGKSLSSHYGPLNIIQNCFEFLNEIPQIKLILKFVAKNENLQIYFDFQRESVKVLNNQQERLIKGHVFLEPSVIYIAAKNLLKKTSRLKVLSILAHEMCHLALFIVYQNSANPYEINNEFDKRKFEKIFEKCDKLKEEERSIKNVFKLYNEENYHKELIVKVPELLVYYFNDDVKFFEIFVTFKFLFDYFDENIVKDMKLFLKE
ncbi:hypothetical protein PVAND_001027 [Polypedilum vanderplanki]|uniref:SprT-like domain-containing protein n=1 Tax=Polypedilum vanderplanki TaxID=319348 RepID=A0A9J6BMX8_POLVA|nr:hypothetical protein PVAND_001027 [Polypedilum vanderplanki]